MCARSPVKKARRRRQEDHPVGAQRIEAGSDRAVMAGAGGDHQSPAVKPEQNGANNDDAASGV